MLLIFRQFISLISYIPSYGILEFYQILQQMNDSSYLLFPLFLYCLLIIPYYSFIVSYIKYRPNSYVSLYIKFGTLDTFLSLSYFAFCLYTFHLLFIFLYSVTLLMMVPLPYTFILFLYLLFRRYFTFNFLCCINMFINDCFH